VVNILHGNAETGAQLVKHPDVAMIAFSGSAETGREIRRATAGSGKRLTLALGGKSPVIVCADADLDAAVEGVVEGLWLNQGATCCAGSRLIVQEGIAPRFLDKLRARMQRLRIGDPLEKNIDMGAVVSAGRKARITALIETARAEGYQFEQSTAPLPDAGHFVAPGFFSDSEPACSLWQAEIFGPIALTTSFRTMDEAVALANNSAYGLAASIWSENVNAATELAARLKAGVVWINAASLLDAAAPFGGVKESGYGREGGRAGLSAYLRPISSKRDKTAGAAGFTPECINISAHTTGAELGDDLVDRTIKNYIGASFMRPETGATFVLRDGKGKAIGLAPLSGRKDIRNAVEAALKPASWAGNAHARAQVLYFLAENLAARETELVSALTEAGISQTDAASELRKSVERIFYYAGMADKVDGGTHATKSRHLTLSIREPLGVVGVVAPDSAPILGLLSLILPLIAMGNSVIAVPSAAHARVIAPLMQILATSDLPAGVVNLVIGDPQVLARTMAEHDAIDALCYHADQSGIEAVERLSAGNLKPVWCHDIQAQDWTDDARAAGPDWLARATQLKTIWLPYGA
jgi:aldehyde dehydrogenase (NAD+)